MNQPETKSKLSLAAVGGVGLAGFAVFAGLGLWALSVAAPNPMFLVLPVILFPMAVAGGVLSGVGLRAARREPDRWRGRRWGQTGLGLGAAAALVILPGTIATGLPRFRAYQLESREQQALHVLSRIRMGAMSHRHEGRGRRFPLGSTGWTPAAAPTSKRYPHRPELWADEPWTSLDFVPSAAHFHQYRYRAGEDGQSFVVQARGDLDGDGRLATYTATVVVLADGRVDARGPVRSPEDER